MEISNGIAGFAYELMGLEGGCGSDCGTLVESYASFRTDKDFKRKSKTGPWKVGMLAFCDWGFTRKKMTVSCGKGGSSIRDGGSRVRPCSASACGSHPMFELLEPPRQVSWVAIRQHKTRRGLGHESAPGPS
jgi:hypothetical protein